MNTKLAFTTMIFLGLGLGSCQKDAPEPEPKPTPVTSFSMQLNSQRWQPSQVGEDKCMQKFHGAWSRITTNEGSRPIFTIEAKNDIAGESRREEYLRIQISNLKTIGVYAITDAYTKDFFSHASFRVNRPGETVKHYTNKTDKPAFWVEVKEFIDLPEFSHKGIRGTFYGTLYNEVNPKDSITIHQGEFLFKKVNWYNYDQCF
ncbi:DUF5025 domain-containing protein [Rufibacter hautae]|uniref:DUF5025 domain-containing protein n=1 Tax=Rufibacter hautae TaxID=2595005 RepID=A0A5B6TD28_9BACT|nr:DUF5025 domain-containing protein [Rufibacter hautae]KAA3437801.1 DUF5025 domain-containing protein [Rufibacter hautae]